MSMKIKDLNNSKIPIVKINNKLNKTSTKVLFPEKVEQANKVLQKVGLPK
jgi:hypothetical protein